MNDTSLPVLMYHGLHATAQSRGRFESVYSVAPEEFSAQLDWLLQAGYRSMRLDDLQANGPETKPVVITFDDGDVSNVEVALPLLRERGMVAEFFVTSDFIDCAGMLTRADVRALSDAGMGVQSHGQSHRYLEDLDAGALADELGNSKRLIEELTGRIVDALALPGGRGGERERQDALRQGYRYLFNSAPGSNRHWQRGQYLQRITLTRGLALAAFADMVAWRGIRPRVAQMRYNALAMPKKLLGNRRYEQLRTRLLRQ
ncbi:MAG: polysaccharide deacetylase family protein [Rudaea sp.]